MQSNKASSIKGSLLAIAAAIFWGLSGTFSQFLFQKKGVDVQWLVTIRLSISGILLLLYAALIQKQDLWQIWKQKRDIVALITFSILGMVAIQYTYFAAIQYSNAGTATVLQYAGPVMIAIFLAIKNKKWPNKPTTLAILLATIGTILLVTHGDFQKLVISRPALLFGLASAVSLAIYTLQPIRLLTQHKSTVVIGWAMLLGGLLFSFIKAPWQASGIWDIYTVLSTIFIILFGTLISFTLYLSSVKLIGGQMTSLLASAEPLSATLIAVWWLHTPFTLIDWIGSICIISTVFFLSLSVRQ